MLNTMTTSPPPTRSNNLPPPPSFSQETLNLVATWDLNDFTTNVAKRTTIKPQELADAFGEVVGNNFDASRLMLGQCIRVLQELTFQNDEYETQNSQLKFQLHQAKTEIKKLEQEIETAKRSSAPRKFPNKALKFSTMSRPFKKRSGGLNKTSRTTNALEFGAMATHADSPEAMSIGLLAREESERPQVIFETVKEEGFRMELIVIKRMKPEKQNGGQKHHSKVKIQNWPREESTALVSEEEAQNILTTFDESGRLNITQCIHCIIVITTAEEKGDISNPNNFQELSKSPNFAGVKLTSFSKLDTADVNVLLCTHAPAISKYAKGIIANYQVKKILSSKD
jgi:hypothetical protein